MFLLQSVTVFVSLISLGCGMTNTEDTENLKTAEKVQITAEQPSTNKIQNDLPPKQDAEATTLKDAPEKASKIRLGKHLFTLHWISWDKPGSVMIKPSENGWYNISGGQKGKNGDYITIEGGVKQINPKELSFRGTIKYVVKRLNKGQPCIKKGVQTFKSTKGRKYWRLQNMINCEGGLTTDYIDIYF